MWFYEYLAVRELRLKCHILISRSIFHRDLKQSVTLNVIYILQRIQKFHRRFIRTGNTRSIKAKLDRMIAMNIIVQETEPIRI